jgi:hypothetical protein
VSSLFAYNIRHILSYITDPIIPPCYEISPEKTFKITGESCYFSPQDVLEGHIGVLVKEVIDLLPPWLVSIWEDDGEWSEEQLVELIAADPDWFPPFPVSLKGTNPNGGSAPITETKQPGPRRLAVSSEIHGPQPSALYKCHIEELYGYSYSFLPRCWMGLRSLRDYTKVAELGVELWKRFYNYLDPVSTQCPPNSCNILSYFGSFKGKIRPHRDNAPNMGIDPTHNSQLLGSSVMVLSLGHPQELQFVEIDKTSNVVDSFTTEHGSVYILRCCDDLQYKHQAKFVHQLKGKARVCLAYRWLGRRTKAFCMDYTKRRQGLELFTNVHKLLEKLYPRSIESREIFSLKRGNDDKALHEPRPQLFAIPHDQAPDDQAVPDSDGGGPVPNQLETMTPTELDEMIEMSWVV